MIQDDLFQRGVDAREDAIDRAEANADRSWYALSRAAVIYVAERHEEFTTDAVWERLADCDVDLDTHEHRAMGGVMRAALRDGIIERTDRTRQSTRPSAHRRPMRVWRSALREVTNDEIDKFLRALRELTSEALPILAVELEAGNGYGCPEAGAEAEELRQLLEEHGLQRSLDAVDARDSLSYLETRDRYRERIERLEAALAVIEGGDNPIDNPERLRRIARQALNTDTEGTTHD